MAEINVVIPRLPSHSFTWSRWRRFNLFATLGMACRYDDITKNKVALRKYAVGWLEGEKLYCRPKVGCVAIMWLKDNEFTWCHLTNKEFIEIFSENELDLQIPPKESPGL